MKKILVTGATGYIGSHVIKQLAKFGYQITATDYNFQQNDISKYVNKCIHWDITEKYNDVLEFDIIIHLAAQTMVEKSVMYPSLYYKTNVLGTINLTEQLVNNPHFIYCSTGSAFNPETSPYAMSKRSAEDIVSTMENYSICRFYNVGGNNGFKKFDNSHYHLIRKTAAVVNGLYDSITIYGTNYNTRDGTSIRNYTHINDIVAGILRIVQHGPTQNIECLGTTTGHTVCEVIKTMKQVSNIDFKVNIGNNRLGDSDMSILPKQSVFFKEEHTLEDQCLSALEYEK